MKPLPTCIYSASSLSFTTRIVFLYNWCTNIDKHYYTKFIVRTGFTFSIVNAVGFNKFIRTYTYHNNSTKNNFTALKILCVLPIPTSLTLASNRFSKLSPQFCFFQTVLSLQTQYGTFHLVGFFQLVKSI